METRKIEREDGPESVSERHTVSPYVDVLENDQEILVVADLPGVTSENLSINLEENELLIEGRRELRKDGSPVAREYRPTDFRRSFVVPSGIERDRIDAHLAAGVLRLRLPKADALRPRRIAVRSG